MMKFLYGFVAAILLAFIAGIVLIFSGAYNVAADKEHTRIAKWILGTAMTNSVKAHADAVAPPRFDDEEHAREGYRIFDEMCVQCHGAPGKRRGEVGLGLRPEPPELSEVADRWSPAELLWIVKHGIIATGMPAFGSTHTEGELWDLVAFVRKLPGMTAEQYRALEEGARAPHEHGQHEHQHGH